MFKSILYDKTQLLGEVKIYPQNEEMDIKMTMTKKTRISHLSPFSKNCSPLAILHTIAPNSFCLKMKSKKLQSKSSPLITLHQFCLINNKTAVVQIGEKELHLVAMSSNKTPSNNPCFWGFYLGKGLYDFSHHMLNDLCLGLVFDLDETLVVTNSVKTFENKIDILKRKIKTEMDRRRVSNMSADVKRYQADMSILKQYVESDQVVESGKVFKVENEVIPPLCGNTITTRPLIRLQEKNIILTRINPQNRHTSVLVRLRPAWENLRSFLKDGDRKRFEVYVCTMAKREYALEMWRLLDPESKLINSCELSNRIVCVKAGSRKSLLNVFHDGLCDPKMALVIDDRLKVWDEKDQPRVHVVPAFAPYHAPQPEEDNVNPVLRVVRNVACEVRGCFFKNFKGRLQQILDVSYDDDMSKLPSPLDVSNFLGDGTVSNKDPLCSIGMADEVERGLKDDDTASNNDPLCSIEMADEVEKGSKDDDTASKEAFLCSIGMVDGVETRLKEHHGDDRVRMDGTHSNNHSYPGGEMPVDQSTFGNSLSPSFDDKDVSLVRSPRTTRIFSLIQKKAPHSIQKLLLGLYKILQSNAVLR